MPGLKLLERALLREGLLRLLREGLRLLKAKQRAVVRRLLRPRTRLPSAGVLVPIIPVAPRPGMGAFLGVEAALQIIDLRLELGELGLEGVAFVNQRG